MWSQNVCPRCAPQTTSVELYSFTLCLHKYNEMVFELSQVSAKQADKTRNEVKKAAVAAPRVQIKNNQLRKVDTTSSAMGQYGSKCVSLVKNGSQCVQNGSKWVRMRAKCAKKGKRGSQRDREGQRRSEKSKKARKKQKQVENLHS